MLSSLLIRLAMFALTMGVIMWIGWDVPQQQSADGGFDGRQGRVADNTRAALPLATATVSPLSEERKSPSRSRTAGTLDLNRATEQDFESLPGIGPVLAGRIVDYRQGVGSFSSVEDLRDVKGIGKRKFERIRSLVHVTGPKLPARAGKKTT